jgi:hypothetical protein
LKRWQVRDSARTDPTFEALIRNAEEEFADRLEREAVRRAVEGVGRRVFYRGEPIAEWRNDAGEVVDAGTPGAKLVPLEIREYSDSLLALLLKANRPAKYADKQQAGTQVSVTGAVQVNIGGLPDPVRLQTSLPGCSA